MNTDAPTSDRASYDLAVAFAATSGNFSEPSIGLLRASLAIREHAAAIEAHRHFFEETVLPRLEAAGDAGAQVAGCAAVAVVDDGLGGLASCTVDAAFFAAVRAAPPPPLPTVRQLRHDYTSAGPIAGHEQHEVVLYGELGTAAFADLHGRLVAAATTEPLRYAVRHRPAVVPGRAPIAVSGYGVEMAIKSTEYKVLDDSKVQQGRCRDNMITQGRNGLLRTAYGLAEHFWAAFMRAAFIRAVRTRAARTRAGALLRILTTRRACCLTPPFPSTADASTSSESGGAEDEDASLPVHIDSPKTLRTEHLPQKATLRILQAADPLAMLRHLAQNLPTTAFALAQMPSPPAAVFEAVEAALQTQGYAGGLVLVNGRAVSAADVNEINPYNLLPLLRRELWVVNELVAAGLSPQLATTVVGTGVAGTGAVATGSAGVSHVVDVRTPAAVFLNDMQKDPRYAQFAGQLNQILGMYLQYPGQMLFLRFNLATVLFVIDPTDLDQLSVLGRISQYIQRAVPLRFAVLFIDNDAATRTALATGASTVDRTTSVTAMLYRAMAAARTAGGDATLHRLLFEYGRVALLHSRVDMETVRVAVRAARGVSWDALVAAGASAGALDELAQTAHADAALHGIDAGSIFVNGEHLPFDRVRPPTIGRACERAPSGSRLTVRIPGLVLSNSRTPFWCRTAARSI